MPVAVRIVPLQPDAYGLYPHEVLLLSYAPRIEIDAREFQGFWWSRYGIDDVSSVLISLHDRGFLESGDITGTLARRTVADLKALLAGHDLPVSGRKTDLIKRILHSVPHAEVAARFPERVCALTQRGQEALDAAPWVLWIHRHPTVENLDIFSLAGLVQAHPNVRFRDLVWSHFNQISGEHFQRANFGLFRNTRFAMADFVAEEHRFKDALSLVAEVVFYLTRVTLVRMSSGDLGEGVA